MSSSSDHGADFTAGAAGRGKYSVDARSSMGVQIGEGNVQIIYTYNRLTLTDGVAPPPLVSVSGAVDSPYRGLSAFGEQDAAFFFGREADTTQVLERMSRQLDDTGPLVVSGVSGAGKSSLLRAGVLPRIRGAGLASVPESASWPCLLFTPSRAPLDELAVRVALLAGADATVVRRELSTDPRGFALTARQAALAQPHDVPPDTLGPATEGYRWSQRRLLLVVDQFEQLFTQCADEEQRRVFITALHAAASIRHGENQLPAALVVLGVRADFEARCVNYPELAGAIQDRYLVPPMTPRQLRMAIAEPAKAAGSEVEEDLVSVLLAELRTRQPSAVGAGVLPLLSHALDQAWRCRTGKALTLADYERTGGIEGAVADSAQGVYDRLSPGQQAAARRVFIRLTATSSDGVDTANRATKAELIGGKSPGEARDIETVLEAFTAQRLLTVAADTVEISHEVLLSAWPLLRDTWLTETHADRIVRTRLHNIAAEWARHSRDPSYLYSGTLLQAAKETADRVSADPFRNPPLSHAERDFLHASDRAYRRSTRRRQALLAFLATLVVGLASVAILAIRSGQQAAHQLELAAYQRDVAVSSQLINQSETLGDTNPAVAKLLSLAAWHIHPSSAARYAMLTAATLPGIAVLAGYNGPVNSVAYSPDGMIVASGSSDATVRLWNVATGQQIGRPLKADTYAVNSVAFSPDGKIVASGGNDGTVRLWDVATHQQISRPLTGRSGDIGSVAFSPDGKMVASGSSRGNVRLWDTATHRPIGGPLFDYTGQITSVAFSPDGKLLAASGGLGAVQLWDLATHQPIGRPLRTHTFGVASVGFSPDSKTLAAAGFNGTVRLWDVATHRMMTDLSPGNTVTVFSVAFSPDGKTLAAGYADGTVRLWDVADGRPTGTFTASASEVHSVAFSPDGKTLATASSDHTVRLWHVATGRPLGPPAARNPEVSPFQGVFSLNGKILVTITRDQVRRWDVATGRPVGRAMTVHASWGMPVALSPNAKILITINNRLVRLWDMATSRPVGRVLTRQIGAIFMAAFGPDGKTLAIVNNQNTVQLWDVVTNRPISEPFIADTGFVTTVAFSPDGKTLATGTHNGTVQLWDVTTHQQIGKPLSGIGGTVRTVAFSPDGKTLATGNDVGTVQLWDVTTHQQAGKPLTGNAVPVNSVVFSPDGKTLATISAGEPAGGGPNGTVLLWDVTTRHEIGDPLFGQLANVSWVAFSADGKALATSTFSGTAQVWDVSYLADAVKYLCASEGVSPTRTEWTRYVRPGLPYQRICP
jgi:WD40 repeat protein